MEQKSAIVLLSGGIDSTTLLYHLHDLKYNVEALSIHYGQRHSKELKCAELICKLRDIKHTVCDLGAIKPLLGGSSQTDDVAVPEGHHADPAMRVTVVPNRNMILLAVAAAMAISHKAPMVAYAAHIGDHAVYPDCRPEFINTLAEALKLCHYDGGVELLAPFSELTKTEIVKLGLKLFVPYHLTWSCYAGEDMACGRCGTCVERLQSFWEAGTEDPIPYKDWEYARSLVS